MAAMHGFAVEYKHYASSDLEVRLCCQTVELTSTRASATHGIERLLWGGGGTMSTGTRGGPAPPQLNVVYSTEEEGDARTLVANLHSTKANLIYDAFLSAAAFFVTDAEGPRGGPANSMTPSPMALRGKLPDVSASSDDGGFLTGLVQADGHRLAEGAPAPRGRLVVLLSLDAAEVMLPRQPHVRDSDGIVLSGAFIVKYRIEPATSMTFIDLEILQLHCYVCGRGGIGSAQAGTVLAPADLSLKMSRGISYDGGIKMEGSLIATQVSRCTSPTRIASSRSRFCTACARHRSRTPQPRARTPGQRAQASRVRARPRVSRVSCWPKVAPSPRCTSTQVRPRCVALKAARDQSR